MSDGAIARLERDLENERATNRRLRNRNERLRAAFRMLYGAHENVVFDTDEDRDLQRQALEAARRLWHEPDRDSEAVDPIEAATAAPASESSRP